jgi:hypothetical protein
MTIDELISVLQERKRILGGHHRVGYFDDEMGTFWKVESVEFQPHKPKKGMYSYNTPPGGALVIK